MNSFVVDFSKYYKLKEENKIDDALDEVLQDLSVGRFVYAMRKLVNLNGKINKFYLPILKEVIRVDSLKKMREDIKNEIKQLKALHQENDLELDQLKANKKAAKEIIKELK